MKDIFAPTTDQLLSESWKKMQTSTSSYTSKPEVIEESKEFDKTDVVEEDRGNSTEEFPEVKSAFNEIFDRMTKEKTLEECDGKKCSKCEKRGCKKKRGYKKALVQEDVDDMDVDGAYEEDVMVSVPKALLDELVSYIEDPMGDEDYTDVDQPEFEELEESFKVVHKKFTETGQWKFLKKAIGHYSDKKNPKLFTSK